MARTVSWTQTTAPTVEPVSRTEAKSAAQIEHTDDDTYIDMLIVRARKWVESRLQRQLVTATWRLDLESFPAEILLPWPVAQSVSSITYTDTDGDSQTVTASDYQTDTGSIPARIKPSFGNAWPAVRSGDYAAVRVTFVAGYGVASDVPDGIKGAIEQLVAHWYGYREHVVEGQPMSVPVMFKSLLADYRTYANDLAFVVNAK